MDKIFEMLKEKLGEEVFTEEVSADFKANIDILVSEKVKELIADKEKELVEEYRKDADEFKSEFIEQVDNYMDYAATSYLKENQVAIQNEYTVKAANELIEAFCQVLENNNFLVEPSKNKAIDELQGQVDKLEESLNEKEKTLLEMTTQVFEYKKAIVFKESTKGFSKVKSEKVLDLLEGLEFADLDDFKKKLSICVERVKTKPLTEKKKIEEKEELKEEKESTDSEIDKYL